MRLAEILKSVINEVDGSEINKLMYECNPFIERNEQYLTSEFYLMRGTKDRGSIVKNPPRQRRSIAGSRINYYFFEVLRNNDIPSRKDLVPCTGGSKLDRRWDHRHAYTVYPIGNNYKLVYSKKLVDFGTSDVEDDDRYIRDPAQELNNIVYFNKSRDIDKQFRSDAKAILKKVKNLLKTGSPDAIKKAYDFYMDYYRREKETIQDEVPEIVEYTEEAKDHMEDILSSLKVTDTLDGEMRGKEIGLYAPDGFYYVSKAYADTIDWGS